MNLDNIDIPNEWELICDYNEMTREVVYCYYNADTEEQTPNLPAELSEFIHHTAPQDWVGHLSTSYLPFKQFYTHRLTNVSIWHLPEPLKVQNEHYLDDINDWQIRSKKLEMNPEIRKALLDFDNELTRELEAKAAGTKGEKNQKGQNGSKPTSPKGISALEQFHLDLIENNRRKYCSSGKVTKDFVCFYRNDITQQCMLELPPSLDKFQLESSSHRDWSPQVSSTIDRFFYLHVATSVAMWEIPLAYQLNRNKHLQNSTRDDWRIFVSSEHKRPLYIHSKSKLTQFELPEPLAQAEQEIVDPAEWSSGINPITNLPYYFTRSKLTLWHLPTALAKIKDEFNKKRMVEKQEALKEKKAYKEMDHFYWEVQYVSYTPKSEGTEAQGDKYISYYKHRYTQECVVEMPPSTQLFIKTTKKEDWVKVNIQDTPLVYYEHSSKIDKDPYHLIAVAEGQPDNGSGSEGVCIWTNPLTIIAHHATVVKQTEAQMVMSNGTEGDLDPEDDIDNWIIYYDPTATSPQQTANLAQAAKNKQRKQSTTSNEDEFVGRLSGGLAGGFDDDDDDDSDFGSGLVSSSAQSGLGDLLSSTTAFQLQGLRLDQIATMSKLNNNSGSPTQHTASLGANGPRTELEEGVEIGGVGPIERRPSFSTFSFSTTQRHLNLSTRGQQLYFNIVTKRIQPELPTCFDLFQQAIENDTPDNWESAVGKIAPYPFYRFKTKKSVVMWHEPIVVRAHRMNVYAGLESENLAATVGDWVIRMVAETNSAYYKNVKTHWYQNEIPEALDEYQQSKKNTREWESFMSNTCVGVVIYSHVLPNGDTGCNLLQKPDCVREKIQQVDTTLTQKSHPVSSIDHRFNAPGTTYQDNVMNWVLQYNSVSNTTYYRNIETHALSLNIPKPLYLLGTNRYSTYQDWSQSAIYFDVDGSEITLEEKAELDDQIAKNPALVKNGKRLYTEKACYVYKIPNNTTKANTVKVFHRPHVLRDHLRQVETTFDWLLIRSTDNSHFLYKNKTTGDLVSDLPESIQKWLNEDVEAKKAEHWVGCVDTTLKQGYYKHKPTNLMVSSDHEPPVLAEIRTRTYTTEEELSQWTIFANKVDNRCYYQNKLTKQCVIGSIPKILLKWSSATKSNEWNFVQPTGTISKGYWYHLKSGTRMWERPAFMDEHKE